MFAASPEKKTELWLVVHVIRIEKMFSVGLDVIYIYIYTYTYTYIHINIYVYLSIYIYIFVLVLPVGPVLHGEVRRDAPLRKIWLAGALSRDFIRINI